MKKKPWKRLSQSDSEAVMRLVDEYQSSIKRIIVEEVIPDGILPDNLHKSFQLLIR